MFKLGRLIRYAALFAIFISACFTANVFAEVRIPRTEEFAENNILFYNPCVPGVNSGGSSSSNSSSSDDSEGEAGGTGNYGGGWYDALDGVIKEYADLAMDMQRKYGTPWELVFAQMIKESSVGTDPNSIANHGAKNNYLGIRGTGDAGSHDGWAAYTSVGASIEDWAGTRVARNGYYDRAFQYLDPDNYDLDSFIREFVFVYAPPVENDSDTYVRQVQGFIKNEIRSIREKYGLPSSAELAQQEGIGIGGENPLGSAIPAGPGSNTSSSDDSGSGDSSSNSNLCPDGKDQKGTMPSLDELIEGGLTLEEAVAFYQGYLNLSPEEMQALNFVTAWSDPNAEGNPLYNCVNFVKWFLATYTDTPADVYRSLPDGGQVVSHLTNTPGTEPQPYAVFSYATSAGGHTGVILGVNPEKDTLVIGEAGCFLNAGTNYAAFHQAKEVSLSGFMAKNPTFYYTQ